MSAVSAAEKGRALYHDIWQKVGAKFFDVSRLVDWGSWEHLFDELIVDELSALRYCDQMLLSLKDQFTLRVVPKVVQQGGSSTGVASPGDRTENVLSVLSPSNIGIMCISSFASEEISDEIEAAAKKIAGCDGLLLDLRPNKGGKTDRTIESCGLFLKEGLLTTIETRLPDGGVMLTKHYLSEDHLFRVEVMPDGSEEALTDSRYRRRPALLAGKPMAVLLHGRTASAAEMFAAAIVQNGVIGKVITVGGDTAGKGIGQSDFDFSITGGKVTIRITCARWFCPGGEWLGDFGQTRKDPIRPTYPVLFDSGLEALRVADHQLRIMLGRITEPSWNQ